MALNMCLRCQMRVVCACAENDTLRSDVARVTAERDALRAEVEAMRELLREARAFVDDATGGCPDAIHRVAGDEGAREAQAMLDRIDEALRKVGG